MDHYNLVSHIFAQNVDFKIGTIVLGGRWQQYDVILQNWLKTHYYDDNSTNKIKKVIFTGVINGHLKTTNRDSELSYARAYSSRFSNWTKTEKEIEKTLQFKGNSPQKPTIKILAMNVGYKEADSEDDSNTSSIVLRIEGKKALFTVTGDADGCTWDFIEGCYLGDTAKLETDYLLLSHHGALRHGCSRESTLKILKPKVCLISTGCFGGNYSHPSGEIIERLVRLGTLSKFGESYPLSFYKGAPSTRMRKNYEEMICSTIDDGTITFKLIEPKDIKKIFVSRNRKEFIKDKQEQVIYFELDVDDVNHPCLNYDPTVKSRNQNSLQKQLNAISARHPGEKIKYFYKHSSMYNLILSQYEIFTIEEGDIYYLRDLMTHTISKIKIKEG